MMPAATAMAMSRSVAMIGSTAFRAVIFIILTDPLTVYNAGEQLLQFGPSANHSSMPEDRRVGSPGRGKTRRDLPPRTQSRAVALPFSPSRAPSMNQRHGR